MIKAEKLNGPLRIGIGGPVGAGKTSLTAAICRFLKDQLSLAVITNDIYTKEDAEFLNQQQIGQIGQYLTLVYIFTEEHLVMGYIL